MYNVPGSITYRCERNRCIKINTILTVAVSKSDNRDTSQIPRLIVSTYKRLMFIPIHISCVACY